MLQRCERSTPTAASPCARVSGGKGLSLSSPALENQRRVGAAKSKRIRKRVFERCFASVIRNVIQIAFRIRILKVDGGWQSLVAQRQDTDAGLKAARAAEKVARHGFRRADGN